MRLERTGFAGFSPRLVLKTCFVALIACWGMVLRLQAQAPDLNPQTSEPPVPTIGFEFSFPGAIPSYYSISLASTGQAAYHSEQMPQDGSPPGDPYIRKFIISQPVRERIFELARVLNFFRGKLEYENGRIANMGAKTLIFENGAEKFRATYNYSTDPNAQEMTRIFQGLSSTLEFQRNLERMHRFQPLALDGELKNLEAADKGGRVTDQQLLVPVLTAISADHAVLNVARRRAESLLQRFSGPTAAK